MAMPVVRGEIDKVSENYTFLMSFHCMRELSVWQGM